MFEVFCQTTWLCHQVGTNWLFSFQHPNIFDFHYFTPISERFPLFKEDFKKQLMDNHLVQTWENGQLRRGGNFPNKKMSALCDIGDSPLGFFLNILPWLSFAARLWRRWFRNMDPQFDGREAQHSYRNGPVKCVIPSRYPATRMTISHAQELHFFWLSIYLEK